MEEPVQNLKCLNCLNEIKDTPLKDAKQFELYSCEYCKIKFLFVNCFHCHKPIYYKAKVNLENIPIKCPYSNCQKIFSLSTCPKCETLIYFANKFPIKCPNKLCDNYFAKVQCPIISCRNIIKFESDKNSNIMPYMEGNILECQNHSPHFLFQKMTCEKCSRALVWNYPKILIRGQKILCPYQDCNAIFNRVNCPKCYKGNIFSKGTFQFNAKYTCIYCGFKFELVFCPGCFITFQPQIENYVEGMKLSCQCNTEFQIVNCFFCKGCNIWRNCPYFFGQKVECANKSCGKIFNKVPCPFCLKFNIFPKGDFSYGSNYKCVYKDCNQTFSIFLCPECISYQVNKEYLEEGKLIKCEKCDTNFFNLSCPHCKNTITGKTQLTFGQTVLCPYENCQRLFNYFYCFECKLSYFDKNNTFSDGNAVRCPSCKASYSYSTCTKCNYANIQKINCDDIEAFNNKKPDSIVCRNCNKSFLQNKVIKIMRNCIPFKFYNGEYINFNQPMKDLFQEKGDEIFFNNSSNYSVIYPRTKEEEEFIIENNEVLVTNQKSEISQCSLCLSKQSESVFIPCGHRCVCLECGELVMSTSRKCPICQSEANFLLSRVYDC